MATVDVEQMKAALISMYEREAAIRPRVAQPIRAAAPGGRDADLRSLLESDPSLAKLAALLTRHRDERRDALKAARAEQLAQAQIDSAAAAAKIADAIEAERTALRLLAQPSAQTYVTLDTPLFILQVPQQDFRQFKDDHIEAFNSWVKVDIDTSSGPGDTTFVAYYLWENPSDQYAVGTAGTSMMLNGMAAAWGSPGKLDGNWAGLYVAVSLTPIRWTGWGTDSAGNSLDGTPYPLKANREIISWLCYGGDWFSSASPKSMPLDSFNWLSIPMIAIPARAVIVFELGLRIDWGFVENRDGPAPEEEDQIDDGVIVDLASKEHMARYGSVVLNLQ